MSIKRNATIKRIPWQLHLLSLFQLQSSILMREYGELKQKINREGRLQEDPRYLPPLSSCSRASLVHPDWSSLIEGVSVKSSIISELLYQGIRLR